MAARSAFVPIQPTPFVFPTFPINPATYPYSSSAEWTCQSADAACRGDEADMRASTRGGNLPVAK